MSPELLIGDALMEELNRQTDEYAALYRRATQECAALGTELEETRKTLATVAHDLRSPLTVVTGVTELLLEGDRLTTEQRDLLMGSQRASAHVTELTGLLVEAVRLSRRTPARVAVDMVDLVEVVASRQRLVRGSERRICLSLPAPAMRPHVLADRLMIDRMLDNLVSNAVKFSPPSGIITIAVQTVGATVRVSVADEGPGIAEDQLAAIFEAFRRGPDAEGTPGLGLGLAIVRQIADAHDAAVSVAARLGGGSVFTVTFPLLG